MKKRSTGDIYRSEREREPVNIGYNKELLIIEECHFGKCVDSVMLNRNVEQIYKLLYVECLFVEK